MINKLGFLTLLAATCLLMNGCISEETNSNAQQVVKQQNVEQQGEIDSKPNETNEENKKKPTGIGPGPVTKGNTSIGDIHIGDTPEQVKSLLGEPDKVSQVHTTPNIEWYYKKENIRVHFYRTMGGDAPLGGVERIMLDNPSPLKTNKGIGIGDSVDKLIQSYEKVEPSHEKIPTNYWVTGSTFTEGVYHPTLRFRVDEKNNIQEIELSNYLIDPAITK